MTTAAAAIIATQAAREKVPIIAISITTDTGSRISRISPGTPP